MLIAEGQRHDILKREWIDRRSNHFFSDTVKPHFKLIEKQQLGERVGSIQTVMLTGEMEQEGIELTLKADSSCVCKRQSSCDKEDSVIC
jgi:hypothetical protein